MMTSPAGNGGQSGYRNGQVAGAGASIWMRDDT
jgi:hypothetical protein